MNQCALLAAMLIALAGCSKSDSNIGNTSFPPPTQVVAASGVVASSADHELGRKIYNFRCYYCHGYSGNAKTLAATFVTPRPVDFTHTSPDALPRERMLASIRLGRPGTAMMSFDHILQPNEIEAVADFVRQEFMINKAENTRYHTVANGWLNHERYKAAYPFALGELALDTPWDKLTPEQADGKQLFLTSCISCHDRGTAIGSENKVLWESYPLSYPRNGYIPGDAQEKKQEKKIDAMTSATPYLIHEKPPQFADLTELEKQGEVLFQGNCSFCHAADGTAKNWIGSFMQPHPRNLTDPALMSAMTKTRLRKVINEGLPGTSMPAWKSVLSASDIEAVIAYVSRAFHPLQPES
jgi:cytochrome c oxidase cbb3-type subunit 3